MNRLHRQSVGVLNDVPHTTSQMSLSTTESESAATIQVAWTFFKQCSTANEIGMNSVDATHTRLCTLHFLGVIGFYS